tara:strand:- start:27624 stop:27797 length:174 start_codon:yes stop_codon:yes gene_type:complete
MKPETMAKLKARVKPAEVIVEGEVEPKYYEVTARDMVLVINGRYKSWPPLTEPQSKG